MHYTIVFLHIFEISKGVEFLLAYNLRNITKKNWHETPLETLKQWYLNL